MVNLQSLSINEGQLNYGNESSRLTNEELYNAHSDMLGKLESKRQLIVKRC